MTLFSFLYWLYFWFCLLFIIAEEFLFLLVLHFTVFGLVLFEEVLSLESKDDYNSVIVLFQVDRVKTRIDFFHWFYFLVLVY